MVWLIVVLVLLVAVVLGIVGGVLLLHRSERAAAEALQELALEERSLAELRELRRMSEMPQGLSRRGLSQCFRRLEILVSVYANERFGVNMGERVDRAKLEELMAKFPSDQGELRHVGELFDGLARDVEERRTTEELRRLVDSAIQLMIERERNATYR